MSYNYRKVIKPYFAPYRLRKLRKFAAIIRHCEKPFRKCLIAPINPDGSHPKWFLDQRPDYAALQWLRRKLSSPNPAPLSHELD